MPIVAARCCPLRHSSAAQPVDHLRFVLGSVATAHRRLQIGWGAAAQPRVFPSRRAAIPKRASRHSETTPCGSLRVRAGDILRPVPFNLFLHPIMELVTLFRRHVPREPRPSQSRAMPLLPDVISWSARRDLASWSKRLGSITGKTRCGGFAIDRSRRRHVSHRLQRDYSAAMAGGKIRSCTQIVGFNSQCSVLCHRLTRSRRAKRAKRSNVPPRAVLVFENP